MVKSRSVHFDGKEEQTTGADDNFIFLSLLLGNYEHMHERLPFLHFWFYKFSLSGQLLLTFGMLGDGGETNEEDAAGDAAAAAVLMTSERRNPDLTRLTWVTLDESLNAANGGDANGDGGRSNTLNSQVNKK